MIKRVNFTGRRRIPRERVQIEIEAGPPPVVSGTFHLADLDFPESAAVVLEAMCAGSPIVDRIECGEVGRLRPPRHRRLDRLGGRQVFFTLKVVDRSERYGRILGLAENVRPAGVERDGRPLEGILPIEVAELGQQVWRLEFREHHVFLLLNGDVPDIARRVRSDAALYALILPEALRHVLGRALAEGGDLEDEHDDRWPALWLRFGRGLHPDGEPPPVGQERRDEWEGWIEEVVQAFCERHAIKDAYRRAVDGRNEDDT
jgi:hypothetical protein